MFLYFTSINKFIQNEVFNKNIKNYLLNLIKDNTFNNKIIKISILKDLNKKFDKYSEDNPELYTYNCDDCDEILFKIINKCKLSTINKILNKYKSDIWTNNNYFCLVKSDFTHLFGYDAYDAYVSDRNRKKLFKKFLKYAETTFLNNYINTYKKLKLLNIYNITIIKFRKLINQIFIIK